MTIVDVIVTYKRPDSVAVLAIHSFAPHTVRLKKHCVIHTHVNHKQVKYQCLLPIRRFWKTPSVVMRNEKRLEDTV